MRTHPLALLTALAVAGCGATTTGGTTQDDINRGGPLTGVLKTTDVGYRIELQKFEVPPGTELMRCAVVEGLPEETLVMKTHFEQTPGGHHVALFTSPTAQPGQNLDCNTSSEMATFRFIAGIDFDGTTDNVAFRIPAGKPFIVQAHYVNATMAPIVAQDAFVLERAPAGATPRIADFFAFNDSAFLLPSGTRSLVHTCTMDEDMEILEHFGHMHELGVHYKLEHLVDGQQPVVLDEVEWDKEYRDTPPRHRMTAANPLVIRAGEQLRLTCSYNNTTGRDVEFPEEMCVSFITYLTSSTRPGGFLTCTDNSPSPVN